MGIFSRITDIINSNIVHMLDKAENPEKMIRLMIQEMEDTLVEVKSSAAKFIADKKTIQRQIKLLNEDQENWQKKAELAISKNRDDLAAAALEEKSKKSETIKTLQEDLVTIDSSLEKFRDDIGRLEEKLADAKKRQKSILTRKQTATTQLQVRKHLHRANTSASINKFEQFEKNLERLEGEVEAFNMGGKKPLDEEFDKLERENSIEKELDELKKKLGTKKTNS